MQKKSLAVVSFFLISIFLAWLVLAASGDGVKIISPASGSNYTTITGILFNVSFINGSDITSPANASFFINLSGTWTKIGNTSADSGCNINSCSATITNTTIPDGVYSINATIYNSTDSASISIINASNLSNIIYIDNTPPIVFASNISNPQTGGNYSQNLILNVSAIDATIGIQTIFFNITNSTGKQNSTVTATREGSTSNYAVTINTSHYPDGYYNITIYANDSLGNLNNSARVYLLVFDNAVPMVTTSNFSSPFIAGTNFSSNVGGLFTLNISASDITSGVSTVVVNITNINTGISNATLTLTKETTTQFSTIINTSHYTDGVYNLTAIVTDYAGNVNRSAVLQNIIFDSTPPTISFSCSPNPVKRDETITCSCSATDTISGINTSYGSSGVSFTANPSTAQTGPSFLVGCSSQDKAGNTASVTTTYSVESTGGGRNQGSSSGGTGLSPPSSGSSASGSSSTNEAPEPKSSVQNSESNANSNTGSSATGLLSSALGIILTIIIAATIIALVVIMIKKKK
jgi:hypothetical protein